MLSKSRILILLLSGVIVIYGLLGGLLDKAAAGDDPYGPLSIFTDVVDKIKSYYVEEPDMQEAFNGALQGMIEALDPFSSFVGSRAFGELEFQAQLEAFPGLMLSKRYGYAYVISVLPGSTAAAEGIRTGDLIESIGGVSTTRMGLWEINARLRGDEGSPIAMRVIRARRTEPTPVTLQRGKNDPGEVEYRILEASIGMLRIPAFDARTSEEIATGLRMLSASSVKGLMVDIRGNAFGSMEEAIQSADLFLPVGAKIVTVEKRDGSSVVSASMTEAMVTVDPLVVLVDGGTSGPAEVFVAALKDNLPVTVVGERTNGLGSSQSLFRLESGAALFLTTEMFRRPSGSLIQAQSLRVSGVEPDVRSPSQQFVTNYYFENTSEDLEESLVDEFYRGLDEAIEKRQFEDAIDQVRQKLQEKAA